MVSLPDDCGTSHPRRLCIAICAAVKSPIPAYYYFFRLVIEQACERVKEFLVRFYLRLSSGDKRAIRRKDENVTRGCVLNHARIARVLCTCNLIMKIAERGHIGCTGVGLLNGLVSATEQSAGRHK